MNIREKLLTVSNDIIPSLGLIFQDYLNDTLEIKFIDEYPANNENLIRIETLIPKVLITGKEFSIWSEEFQSLVDNRLEREYLISLRQTHQLCFNAFCNYFEILSIGLSTFEAQIKFDEFLFYLELQTKHKNDLFAIDYKRYWREFLLRLIAVFETQETTFPSLFSNNLHQSILRNLQTALKHTPPRTM